MGQVAAGHINDRPFVRTVYTIGAKRFSGDLSLTENGVTYRIAWHRGFVVGAEVPDADGALGDRAARIFSLADATFDMDDNSTVVVRANDEPVDPRWLIFHGVRQYYALERLEQELRIIAGRTVVLSKDAISAVEIYGFPEEAAGVVTNLLRQPWELPTLCAESEPVEPRLLHAVVYALLATDALEVGRGVAHQPAGVTASPPSAELPGPAPVPRGKAPATSAPDAATSRGPAVKVDGVQREIDELFTAIEAGANHFSIFGLDERAPAGTIRMRYFDLAKRLHPDRVRAMDRTLAPKAQKVFARINEAFGVLNNDAKRRDYIATLASGGGNAQKEAEQEAKLRAIIEAEERFQLGEMALRRQQFREALEQFQQAVELNPDEAEHHALCAWAHWCASSDKEPIHREVKKQLQRAIALSPNNPRAYFYRGQIAKQSDDTDAAIAAFEKVLKLNPEHDGALLELRLLDRRLADEQKKSQRMGFMGRLRKK